MSSLKKRNIKVDYHTIEPNPLNDSVLEKLNFSKIIGSVDEIFKIIHKSKTDELVEIDKKITFLKSVDTIENIKLKERKYDIIFFDALLQANNQTSGLIITLIKYIPLWVKIVYL